MSLRDGVPYVAAVYLIVWMVVLAYMALIGAKVARLEADLERLEAEIDRRASTDAGTADAS